jgi:hypothetical protein
VAAGSFLYVATEDTGFNSFFGFLPDYTSAAASINGDDALELFENGLVVDIYGDINVDGSGQSWEYMDGWAYRVDGSGPDGTVFDPSNWTYSGPNALDGVTSNDAAGTPFALGSYSPDLVISSCSDPATLIHAIQGSGLTSPLVGETHTIEGVVVGDFQNKTSSDNGDLAGFFVQEEDKENDGLSATSGGIFPPRDRRETLEKLTQLRNIKIFEQATYFTLGVLFWIILVSFVAVFVLRYLHASRLS